MSEPFFYQTPYKSGFVANMASRVHDVVVEQSRSFLREKGAITPVSDVSLMMCIKHYPKSSIAELARLLDYSHQRTSARIAALLKLGLLTSFIDENDSRCKRFTLSDTGLLDFEKLSEVYRSVSEYMDAIFAETGVNLMQDLSIVLDSIKKTPIPHR